MKFLLAIIMFTTGVTALVRPWVGIVLYYLLAILGPQYIWWWHFEGLRASLIVAITTLAGIVFQAMNKNYDSGFLLNRLNLWVLILWFCIAMSFFFGPYVDLFSSTGRRPEQIFSITNTIFLFYFCSTIEINEIRKLRYLIIMFSISTIYLIYWANNQYFNQNWSQFNMGRLMGPRSIDGGSIYRDENVFAVVFVTGIPFIYYTALELQRKWQRYLILLLIPAGWHAIFLTGSRGGLLGVGVVVFGTILLSKRKFLALPLLVLFFVFYQWQAGSVMKDRSDTIANYEGEGSAEMRITAWKGGMKMITEHPITGVGIGSFITALPHFADTSPRVAHNTIIQFAAESGVGAGVAYLIILYSFYLNSRKIRTLCSKHVNLPEINCIDRYNNANTVSFVGLIVCSLFLSLNTYEIFFVLLIFNNALMQICLRKTEAVMKNTIQVV